MMLRLLPPLLLVAGAAVFCRYTVRDVAFVDFGDDGYALHAVISTEETPDLAAELTRIGSALMLDTNVSLDAMEVGAEPTPEVAAFLAKNHVASLPSIVLVDPDGRSLVRPLPARRDEDAERTLVLDAVVSSPARRALVDGVVDHYGAVLLVEGSDATANRAARAIVDKAFGEVDAIFDRMPKDVGEPPVLVTVPFAERPFEQVLLWSIGLVDADVDATAPAVAVFMGRVRRVGPVLVGGEITDAAVFGILSVIGQSGECDLDRSWMQGPRPPLRWDVTIRERAANRLGFDPESPMVRSEMLGILARGPGARPRAETEGRSLEELLLGYEELVVEDLEPRKTTETTDPPPAAKEEPAAKDAPPAEPPSAASAPDEPAARALGLTLLFVIIGVMALGVVLVGVGLLVARRER